MDEVSAINDTIVLLDQKITEAEAARLDLIRDCSLLVQSRKTKPFRLRILHSTNCFGLLILQNDFRQEFVESNFFL